YALVGAVCIFSTSLMFAQDLNSPAPATPKPPSPEGPSTATSKVMRTNSMAVLDDKKKLGSNDYGSFRVVEDRYNDSQRLSVNDNGELEVPYVGLFPARRKSCKELAHTIISFLEKELYYQVTVIFAVYRVSKKSVCR